MHSQGVSRRKDGELVFYEASDTFLGRGVFQHAKTIRRLIAATGARTLLDYGSGKGRQYSDDVYQNGKKIAETLHEYWQIQNIACYDPGIVEDAGTLSVKYDGVIATNVLSLIPEEDIRWVVTLLFSRADKFVFCNVMDYASATFLPSGENACVTRRSSLWWRALFTAENKKYPNVRFCIAYGTRQVNSEGETINKLGYLHNCQDLSLSGKGDMPMKTSMTSSGDGP